MHFACLNFQLNIHADLSRPHLFTVCLGCMQFCFGQSRWHITSMGYSSTGKCQCHCCTPVKYASPMAHLLFNIRSGLFLDSPVAAVAVDGSGQLLSAGYEDASCLLYDLRGKRVVQSYKPHSDEIRSVRFSVHSYYLLSASYDKRVVMTSLHGKDVQYAFAAIRIVFSSFEGDLTKPLILSNVAAHTDKIIQARWSVH
jgi:WD40 repeat protein